MSLITVPRSVYIAVASADSITELNAFDECLVKVGLPNVSLIKVTSLLPTDVKVVEKPPEFPNGANVPSIYATVSSCKSGEKIVAAIAIGKTNGGPTLVAELADKGIDKNKAEETILEMLKEMARVRGLQLLNVDIRSVEHTVRKCGAVLAIVAEIE